MATNYILKNCNLYVGGVSLIGQLEELKIPSPEVKVEEFRNGGMVKPTELPMGWEKLEMEFTVSSVNPALIAQLGAAPGGRTALLAAGALQDEDAERVRNASCFVTGRIKKVEFEGWKPAEKAPLQFMVAVDAMDFSIEGVPLIHMDPYDVTIGGVSQTQSIRDALLAS